MENEGWQEVGTGFGETHDFEVTPELVGKYIGSREVPITVQGERRVNTLHEFVSVDTGEFVSAWGSFVLDGKLRGQEGKMTRVVYQGKTDYGQGREAKQFQVFTR